MTNSASAFPDDVDTLDAMLVAGASQNAELQGETVELKAEVVRMVTLTFRQGS